MKLVKMAGTEEAATECIKFGRETMARVLNNGVYDFWKNKMSDEWEYNIIIPIHKKGRKLLLERNRLSFDRAESW